MSEVTAFWKANEENGFLSNWYRASFKSEGYLFLTAEHYIMWFKAVYFSDQSAANAVLGAKTPAEAKSIGRRVRGFVEKDWLEIREFVAEQAVFLKFSQNEVLKERLLRTKGTLVEASPYDSIWGAGVSAQKLKNGWKGLNLLGKALMKVRHDFLSEKSGK